MRTRGGGKFLDRLAEPPGGAKHGTGGSDNDHPPGRGPDRKLGRGIARIVEALRIERSELRGLGLPFEVAYPVARHDPVEDGKTPQGAQGHQLVGGGGEHDLLARRLLRLDMGEQSRVGRQSRDVEHGAFRDAALEEGPPPRLPQQHHQQHQRVAPQQRDDPFQKEIRAQQRAVEVDHQWHRPR